MRVSVHKQKAQFVDVVAQVGYVAAKQGVHTLPDGRVFEAGEVDTMARSLNCKLDKLVMYSHVPSNLYRPPRRFKVSSCSTPTGATESWDTVQLQSFTNAPVLVTQIQTANNEEGTVPSGASQPWLTAVANTVTSSSFLVALDSAETKAQRERHLME